MQIIPGFFLREIAGETIAVPTGEAGRQLSGLVVLNGSGKFLFELLQEERSEDELVSALMQNYEVDEAVARADAADFLSMLRKHGMLTDTPLQA